MSQSIKFTVDFDEFIFLDRLADAREHMMLKLFSEVAFRSNKLGLQGRKLIGFGIAKNRLKPFPSWEVLFEIGEIEKGDMVVELPLASGLEKQ